MICAVSAAAASGCAPAAPPAGPRLRRWHRGLRRWCHGRRRRLRRRHRGRRRWHRGRLRRLGRGRRRRLGRRAPAAAGRRPAGEGGGAMSGGAPVRPMLACVPMKIGFRSSCVSSCDRTMCGVSSMTMSVCATSLLLLEKSCLRMGRRKQARKALQRAALVLAQQAREQVHLALAQPQPRRHLARPEGRRGLAADLDRRAERAALHGQVEDDLVVVGHARRHLDDDADGPVVVGRHRHGGDAARRGAAEHRGQHGDVLAEVQRELGALRAPQLRLGDELGLRVALEELDLRGGHRQVEVGGADALRDRVQVEVGFAVVVDVAARARAGRRGRREDGAHRVVAQVQAELLRAAAVHLEDLDVDHDLGARLVVGADDALDDVGHGGRGADR